MLDFDRPSSLLPLCTELTIPDVIVFRKANGLPMATTNSPCRTSDDEPRVSVGRGCYNVRGGEERREGSEVRSTSTQILPWVKVATPQWENTTARHLWSRLHRHRKSNALIVTHLGRDFDGGDVCHRVNILHGGIVRLSVCQLHTDASLVRHDVRIGDNEAVTADDEAGAVGHRNFPPRKRVPVEQSELNT